MVVPDIFPEDTDVIRCMRRLRWLNQCDKRESYFIDNLELPSEMHICLGAYIYYPKSLSEAFYENIPYFEHYKADDVAFTAYFNRLGFKFKDIPSIIKTEEHGLDCEVSDTEYIIRTQCNETDMETIYSKYYHSKLN